MMSRQLTFYLTRGVGVCVLLLVLLYMYRALKGELALGPQSIRKLLDLGKPVNVSSSHRQKSPDQEKPVIVPSSHRQGPSDQGKLVHIPTKDVHLPAFINVVDPVSLFPNKTTGAVSESCIRTKTVPSFRVCLYPPKQDYISQILRSSGVWESHITSKFQMALRNIPQATIIDIGSQIGYYSLLAAAMGHPVIAVEAVKPSMEKLALGVQMNGVADKVYVLHNAVAESHKKVSMVGMNVEENTAGRQTVQTLLIDDLIPLIHTRDVIIIMDIEGYECRVIAGSTKLFRDFHVAYVFMEWGYMYNHRLQTTAPCPAEAMRQVSEDHFGRQGYIAHDSDNNKVLDPHSGADWRSGNVYWRYKDHPQLIPH